MAGRRYDAQDLTDQEFQAIRKDTPGPLAENNYFHPLLVDGNGKLWVNLGDAEVQVSVQMEYLGEEVRTGNDNSQNATLPTGTKEVWIGARGGPVYGSINAAAAAASSGIYVPENSQRVVPAVSNLTSLGIWAAAGDFAHLVYLG